jgi:hypothetical protein
MKQNEININAETNVMRVLNNTKRNQIKSIATRPRKALQGNNILVVAQPQSKKTSKFSSGHDRPQNIPLLTTGGQAPAK